MPSGAPESVAIGSGIVGITGRYYTMSERSLSDSRHQRGPPATATSARCGAVVAVLPQASGTGGVGGTGGTGGVIGAGGVVGCCPASTFGSNRRPLVRPALVASSEAA